jgi:hypothetical protein
MTVIQEVNKDTYKALENFPTQRGAKTITLNSKTHRIYLPTAEFDATPAPTTENPRPRPAVKPNTFTILEIEPM